MKEHSSKPAPLVELFDRPRRSAKRTCFALTSEAQKCLNYLSDFAYESVRSGIEIPPMRVWITNPYVNLPGEPWREGRSSLVSRALVERGHEVLFFTSNFSHRFKSIRCKGWEDREILPGYTVRLVPSTPYQKNVGFARMRFENVFSKRMYKNAKLEKNLPDVIITVEPPQVTGHYALKLAKHTKALLVVDVPDLWPEFWIGALPKPARRLEKLLFFPFYQTRKRNLKFAHAYVSLAGPYVTHVQEIGDPLRTKPSCLAYNGIDVASFRSHLPEGAEDIRARNQSEVLQAVFAGSLGSSYDIDAIIRAAEKAETMLPNLRFCIAGDGPKRAEVEAAAARLKNFKYVGRLGVADLVKLYGDSHIGLCSYAPFSNVEMPDKFYDYCAAGLFTVNSLTGEVKAAIDKEQVGLTYKAGDEDDLLRVLKQVCEDSEFRIACAERGWKIAPDYDGARQVHGIVDMLEKMIGA